MSMKAVFLVLPSDASDAGYPVSHHLAYTGVRAFSPSSKASIALRRPFAVLSSTSSQGISTCDFSVNAFKAAALAAVHSATPSAAGPKVVVEGDVIQEWTFGPNNTLTFKAQQGFDGWLQFVHLPGSPIVVGKIREFEGNNVNSAPFLLAPRFAYLRTLPQHLG